MESQSVTLQPLRQHFQHPLGVLLILEAEDKSSSPGELHPQALTEPDG
jgi:hypothetical protein